MATKTIILGIALAGCVSAVVCGSRRRNARVENKRGHRGV